jgi:hypothetical protein
MEIPEGTGQRRWRKKNLHSSKKKQLMLMLSVKAVLAGLSPGQQQENQTQNWLL